MQLDLAERGFSFRRDGPLDMRMGRSGRSAADIVAASSAEELTRIFREYGEERMAAKIARGIVAERARGPITRTRQLARIVANAKGSREKIDPATRVFQALRIEVNQELVALSRFLAAAVNRAHARGRIAVISYHSLEDRVVKETFRRESGVCLCPPRIPALRLRRPDDAARADAPPDRCPTPSASANPRSRSARLRVAEKLEDPNRCSESEHTKENRELVAMSTAAYAQGKRVENLHLTRERDRRRGRELATLLLVGLPVAWRCSRSPRLHIETVRVGYAREARVRRVLELDEENRRLRAELARASSPERVAALAARKKLHPAPSRADPVRPGAAARRGPALNALCARRARWFALCSSSGGRPSSDGCSDVQVAQGSKYRARAQRQQERRVEVSPRRGSILDRNGRELAVSVECSSIYAIPEEVRAPGRGRARPGRPALAMTPAEVASEALARRRASSGCSARSIRRSPSACGS